jgi:hypothetical protein
MKSLQLEITELREQNSDKAYEILEWEIREVLENEGILIRENPLDFSASVQRKYFWASAEDWKFPPSVDPESEIPEWGYLYAYLVTNPYTSEERTIYQYRNIYIPPPPSRKEIGDIIVRDAFDGNPHAQMADLTSWLLWLAYLLVQVVGKDAVNQAIGWLRGSIDAVSNVREDMGLSRYNLSFLD